MLKPESWAGGRGQTEARERWRSLIEPSQQPCRRGAVVTLLRLPESVPEENACHTLCTVTGTQQALKEVVSRCLPKNQRPTRCWFRNLEDFWNLTVFSLRWFA